jgi:radical SAM superfamily enzyme YgiQ (UPF0313 family)
MKQAVRLLTGAGYSAKQLDAYVIMGLPGQDLEEVLASMVFVNDLGVQIRLASYSPIPGTRDFMRAVASQQIQSDIDPLLTNKSVFPLRASENEYNTYINIRVLSHLLNNAAEKGLRLFTDPRIGPGLKKVIGAV